MSIICHFCTSLGRGVRATIRRELDRRVNNKLFDISMVQTPDTVAVGVDPHVTLSRPQPSYALGFSNTRGVHRTLTPALPDLYFIVWARFQWSGHDQHLILIADRIDPILGHDRLVPSVICAVCERDYDHKWLEILANKTASATFRYTMHYFFTIVGQCYYCQLSASLSHLA